MKVILCLLFSIAIAGNSYSQNVHCRPRQCMIDYNLHNDSFSNFDKTTILSFRPEILIDNTEHSYWGQRNRHRGCIPSYYTASGIKVFSYIVGGYEGNTFHTDEDNLMANLARIDSIATDGAAGVFLDMVSHHPVGVRMNYIDSIYNRCVSHGLQLILNTGTSSFDTFLMRRCHYIMTDEGYYNRAASTDERNYLNRILVVADTVLSDTAAASVSLNARANGFGYSYACDTYTYLPIWLGSYDTLITTPPIAPHVTYTGGVLYSSAHYGNQWYKVGAATAISGATSSTFAPTASGSYYVIVTIDSCVSDTSNIVIVTVSTTAIATFDSKKISISPNPSGAAFTLTIADNKPCTLIMQDILGRTVKLVDCSGRSQSINIDDIPDGNYVVTVLQNSVITGREILIKTQSVLHL